MHALGLKRIRPSEFSQPCDRASVDPCLGHPANCLSELENLGWISAGVLYPPAINNVGVWSKNNPKKCQQKCQQNSSKVVQGPFSRSSPASFGNSPISVPKTRGEGRRFRPSPPSLEGCPSSTWPEQGSESSPEYSPNSTPAQHSSRIPGESLHCSLTATMPTASHSQP